MNILGICGSSNCGKDTVAGYVGNNYGFKRIALADPIKELCRTVFDWNRDQLWGASHFRNDVDGRYRVFRPEMGADAHFHCDAAWGAARSSLHGLGSQWIESLFASSRDYPQSVATPTAQASFREQAYEELCEWFHNLGTHFEASLSPRVALQTLGTEWGRDKVSKDIWINYTLVKAKEALLEKEFNGVVISDIRYENELRAIKQAGGKIVYIERPGVDGTKVGISNHASETEQKDFDQSLYNFILKNDGTLKDLYGDVEICMTCLGLT